ncbi:MAG: DUF4384 domain-containing protein [Methylococcales bacterium]|nr:DUF4384 domain-containing protein [Methylococcales bacterium]MBT7409413.1 DUF4384 domain-containing protein [Methylococcales bacterium]
MMKQSFLNYFLCSILIFLSHHANALATDDLDEQLSVWKKMIPSSKKVAIVPFYNGINGDITGLGDLWRDRVENSLRKNKIKVAARRDLVMIMEEVENFHDTVDMDRLTQKAQSAYIVVGRYYQSSGKIELHLKLLQVTTARVKASAVLNEKLSRQTANFAYKVRGNIYHQRIDKMNPDQTKASFSATLNRKCFPTGGEAILNIKMQPERYLYILNLSADDTVTLLHPNRLQKNKAVSQTEFTFPPVHLRKDETLSLLLYPMNDQPTYEKFKVISSDKRLDFSNIPVPENALFTGAKGGDMKLMLDVLSKSKNWQVIDLDYEVGKHCR